MTLSILNDTFRESGIWVETPLQLHFYVQFVCISASQNLGHVCIQLQPAFIQIRPLMLSKSYRAKTSRIPEKQQTTTAHFP